MKCADLDLISWMDGTRVEKRERSFARTRSCSRKSLDDDGESIFFDDSIERRFRRRRQEDEYEEREPQRNRRSQPHGSR